MNQEITQDTYVYRVSDIVKGVVAPIKKRELEELDRGEEEVPLETLKELSKKGGRFKGTYIHRLASFYVYPGFPSTLYLSGVLEEFFKHLKESMSFDLNKLVTNVETRFYVNMDGIWVTGKIDRVSFGSSIFFIWDWKTGRKYDAHVAQIGGYILLAKNINNFSARSFLVYEDLRETVEVSEKEAVKEFLKKFDVFKKNLKKKNDFFNESKIDPIFERYAKLKNEEKTIKKELELLAPQVLSSLKKQEGSVKSDFGQFLIQTRKSGGDFELKKSEIHHLSSYLKDVDLFEKFFKYKQEKTIESIVFRGINDI
jgi:hypothetical protein